MDDKDKTWQEKIAERRKEIKDSVETMKDLPERVKPMSVRTSAMIRMAAIGYTKKQIAKDLNLSETRVYHILSSSGAKREIERIQNEFFFNEPQKAFKARLPKAFKAIDRLLSPKAKESSQLLASKEVFDRAMGKSVQPVEHTGSAIKELLMAMDKKNRQEEAIEAGFDIVDAEFREVKTEEKKDEFDLLLDKIL